MPRIFSGYAWSSVRALIFIILFTESVSPQLVGTGRFESWSSFLEGEGGKGNQNQNSHIVILVMSRRLSKGFVNLNNLALIYGESDFPENGEYVINIIQTSVVSEMLLPAMVALRFIASIVTAYELGSAFMSVQLVLPPLVRTTFGNLYFFV